MPDAEFFTFTLPPSIWKKKPYPSPFKMTKAEAADRYPGAIAIEASREVRTIGDGRVVAASEELYGRQHGPK